MIFKCLIDVFTVPDTYRTTGWPIFCLIYFGQTRREIPHCVNLHNLNQIQQLPAVNSITNVNEANTKVNKVNIPQYIIKKNYKEIMRQAHTYLFRRHRYSDVTLKLTLKKF